MEKDERKVDERKGWMESEQGDVTKEKREGRGIKKRKEKKKDRRREGKGDKGREKEERQR